MHVSLHIPGIPVPKGSAKGFYNRKTGRVIITQTNRERQKPWASLISTMVSGTGMTPVEGPVFLDMIFVFPRPKSHYRGKARELRVDAPRYHTIKPDADKLVRCVCDALTQIAWHDDSQAQILYAIKTYEHDQLEPGLVIKIEQQKGEAT